jgi:hypothetical protein
MVSLGDEGMFNNPSIGSGELYDGSTGDFDAYIALPHISFGTYPSYFFYL